MKLDEYQLGARTFAIYADPVYPVLGLTGEAGEFADKIAKVLRVRWEATEETVWESLTPAQRNDLMDELGDVLWMVAACASELEVPLAAVAEANLRKLASRKQRGVIAGSGDNR
jgi:NTP pyrophosphatase (non-canonical NTP hydrolase)